LLGFIIDLLWRLVDKLRGYIKYSLVGMVGVGIHFGVLWLLILTEQVHLWYMGSAAIAILLASTNNYFLNYLWTFKDRKGNISNHFVGWFKFLLSIGMTEALYLGLLYLFTEMVGYHYMLSAFISLSLTTVLRYKVATNWIWGKKKAKQPTKLGSIVSSPLKRRTDEE